LELANPSKAVTVQGRVSEIWPIAWERFVSNPFGYGLGSFHTTRLNALMGYDFFIPPHNMYFQIALETGVIGLLCFLILIWYYFWNTIKAYQTMEKPPKGRTNTYDTVAGSAS
jgi:O-antigen ligase